MQFKHILSSLIISLPFTSINGCIGILHKEQLFEYYYASIKLYIITYFVIYYKTRKAFKLPTFF